MSREIAAFWFRSQYKEMSDVPGRQCRLDFIITRGNVSLSSSLVLKGTSIVPEKYCHETMSRTRSFNETKSNLDSVGRSKPFSSFDRNVSIKFLPPRTRSATSTIARSSIYNRFVVTSVEKVRNYVLHSERTLRNRNKLISLRDSY